jgi:hypothetical protein
MALQSNKQQEIRSNYFQPSHKKDKESFQV